MKLQLLFQKTYFKAGEWKEFTFFLKSLDPNSTFSISLLSKNTFFPPLKKIKEQFLGECFLIEINMASSFDVLSFCFDVINKVCAKYTNRFFFIGFLIEIDNIMYFFSKNNIKNYLLYLNSKKQRVGTNYSINQFLLYEFFKFVKLSEVQVGVGLSFFKNYNSFSYFNYYY
jgi:hypothetical protein